jgi:hypothetical protein
MTIMSSRQPKLAAAFLMLMGALAFGRSNTGTITGTVSDPPGAVVPAAQIEVRNSETGVVCRGGTSNTGNYVIPVPVGTYQITVNVPGFKKFVEADVPVVTATDTRRDVTLQVGGASEPGRKPLTPHGRGCRMSPHARIEQMMRFQRRCYA